MIKCKNCNAVFSNERIYNMHIILCSNKSDNKKENEEKIEENKPKRTTSRKKNSREDN